MVNCSSLLSRNIPSYKLFSCLLILLSLGGPRCIFLTVHFTVNYNNSDRTTIHFVTIFSFFNSDTILFFVIPPLTIYFFLNTFFLILWHFLYFVFTALIFMLVIHWWKRDPEGSESFSGQYRAPYRRSIGARDTCSLYSLYWLHTVVKYARGRGGHRRGVQRTLLTIIFSSVQPVHSL